MQSSVRYVTVINLLSILLLAISGVFSGITKTLIYVLAFLIPVSLSPVFFKRVNARPLGLKLKADGAALLCPLVFPTILIIVACSFFTSMLFGIFGVETNLVLEGPFYRLVFEHALLPSVLEELLYRFFILAMMLPFSKRGAIIYSAAFFAFAHCDVLQIPYALMAGLIFAFIDVMLDSVLPSLIIHFLNNLISLRWLTYLKDSQQILVLVLAGLSLVSVTFLIIKRKKYISRINEIFIGDNPPVFCYEALMFLFATIIIAVTKLI